MTPFPLPAANYGYHVALIIALIKLKKESEADLAKLIEEGVVHSTVLLVASFDF